eukprot:scaffold497_cov368-Prasinococcus_capsulatus_cf.AAC.16
MTKSSCAVSGNERAKELRKYKVSRDSGTRLSAEEPCEGSEPLAPPAESSASAAVAFGSTSAAGSRSAAVARRSIPSFERGAALMVTDAGAKWRRFVYRP